MLDYNMYWYNTCIESDNTCIESDESDTEILIQHQIFRCFAIKEASQKRFLTVLYKGKARQLYLFSTFHTQG